MHSLQVDVYIKELGIVICIAYFEHNSQISNLNFTSLRLCDSCCHLKRKAFFKGTKMHPHIVPGDKILPHTRTILFKKPESCTMAVF
jgi:hypothetical protein